jgi:2-dehydro-3-deoxyphosphooctonate aldolase (KDO 8-P synthase)
MQMRIIAGPCQHESLTQSSHIAQKCKEVCDKYGIEYIFKASFDKANRSSLGNKRGVGLANTLNDFKLIKEVHGVKTLTDVHDVDQIEMITSYFNECVDVLQIPAFLCRQTDLLQAACETVTSYYLLLTVARALLPLII